MRITDNMRTAASLAGTAKASERLMNAARVASSGMRVEKPSDDPTAYAQTVKHDAHLAMLKARTESADRAKGDLDVAESALAASTDLMVRAKEIALSGANGGLDAAARANLAEEVEGLRQSLLGYANSKGATGYLFGGTRTDVPPFDAAANFGGNDATTKIEVGNGVTANGNTSGARAFTAAGGADLFANLANLATALRNNDLVGIQTSIGTMDDGHKQLVAAQVDAGLASRRLGSASEIMQSSSTLIQAARARESEADPTTAYSDLVSAKGAYERSLSITRELLSISSFKG